MAGVERDLQSIKEEVRSRTEIVEVIGQYIQLKRSGKSWTGLCPFHADRKPSFNVSPQIQWYQCWSCGEKGCKCLGRFRVHRSPIHNPVTRPFADYHCWLCKVGSRFLHHDSPL